MLSGNAVHAAGRERIHLLDTLRGAALLAILLIHCVEHFSLFVFPAPGEPGALPTDGIITHATFLLFFGKAHGIFAFLFGVSYHIQFRNNLRKGIAHRSRMARRMAWLFVFGIVHGMFYPGDILCLLALFGYGLLAIGGASTRWLLTIAILMAIQPMLIAEILSGSEIHSYGERNWERLIGSLRNDGFFQLLWNNTIQNRLIEWSLGLSSGRIFHLGAWMLLGIAAMRAGMFDRERNWSVFHSAVLVVAGVVYAILAVWNEDPAMADLAARYKEMLLVAMYISGALLLARWWNLLNVPSMLSKYGGMSLTNYVGQGVLGSLLFYGFGASFYQLGATLSLLPAVIMFGSQIAFTWWWSRRSSRGPLERIWADLAGSGDAIRIARPGSEKVRPRSAEMRKAAVASRFPSYRRRDSNPHNLSVTRP